LSNRLDDWLHEQATEHRTEQANAERALAAARKGLCATEKRLERLLDDYEALPPDEATSWITERRAARTSAGEDAWSSRPAANASRRL
jgi:hypothetical protein